MGFVRSDAAKLAFLIGIAANLGGSVKKLRNAYVAHTAITWQQIECGILTFFIGLATISLLMQYIRSHSVLPFVIYRVILGSAMLGLIYAGAINAWHV